MAVRPSRYSYVSVNILPVGSSEPGTAIGVEPLSISMAVFDQVEMDPGVPFSVAEAFVNVTVPKLASVASEQESMLQMSGRSTIHSAEDCSAPEKAMFVEKSQLWGSDALPESEHRERPRCAHDAHRCVDRVTR